MNNSTLDAIKAHAAREFPRECCGMVVIRKGRETYIPVRNIAEDLRHFVMHPEDQANAEDCGELIAIAHSHPNIPAIPSQADLAGCEATGVPWIIVSWPSGQHNTITPSGYTPPLYGREFYHGVLDCYSFIRQYYLQELQIEIPDFERTCDWWLKGQNLYLEGFEKADFVHVLDTPQKHDVLLMRVASQVPNHGAVYLGDGLIGHHQTGRLSSKDVYGGWYSKITTHVLRHRSFTK